MEQERLTLEQKYNLKMAHTYLSKVIRMANVNAEYYGEIEEMMESIEGRL